MPIAYGQIVNLDTLSVTGGVAVFVNDYTNNGYHTQNGDVHFQGDLTNNDTLFAGSGQTIFSSAVSDIQQISGGAKKLNLYHLTLNLTKVGAKGVIVEDKFNLQVQQSVSLLSGDLRLEGEAQLVQTHTGLFANSGTGNVLIDQQGTPDIYDFNYWTSPVGGVDFRITDVLYDGNNVALQPFDPPKVQYTSSFDGQPTDPVTLSSRWFFNFNNSAFDDPSGWQPVLTTDLVQPAMGVTMKGTGVSSPEQNYTFKGIPNDGDYNHPVSPGNFTLIGNPYPSALDAKKFITDNLGIMESGSGLFFWEHFGGGSHETKQYQGGYAVYTLAGGTVALAHPSVSQLVTSGTKIPQDYIPVAQSFFVQSNSTGGQFVFKNSQRAFILESSGDAVFTKANDDPRKKITFSQVNSVNQISENGTKIRIGHEGQDGFHRQLLIAFIDGTTDEVDNGFDAKMIDKFSTDAYWHLDNTSYVIQARPFRTDLIVDLGVISNVEQTHTFMIDSLEGFTGEVFLLDQSTGQIFDMKVQNPQFTLPAGSDDQRFKLVFANNTLSTNEEKFINSGIKGFYFKSEGAIKVFSNNENVEQITIYNISGQEIKTIHLSNSSTELSIPFEQQASGIYFLKIRTLEQTHTLKIVKY